MSITADARTVVPLEPTPHTTLIANSGLSRHLISCPTCLADYAEPAGDLPVATCPTCHQESVEYAQLLALHDLLGEMTGLEHLHDAVMALG